MIHFSDFESDFVLLPATAEADGSSEVSELDLWKI